MRFQSLMCGLVAIAAIVSSSAQAKASAVYTSGSLDGTSGAWQISGIYSVADSFTVGPTTLTSATVGLWVQSGLGNSPGSVDWSIGTAAGDSSLGTGVSSFTANAYQFTNGDGFDIYESAFPLSATLVTPGTYWLTLSNATLPNGNPVNWDQNSGSSSAVAFDGIPADTTSIGSEYFQARWSVFCSRTLHDRRLVAAGRPGHHVGLVAAAEGHLGAEVIVAFRSAKVAAFAERKATMRRLLIRRFLAAIQGLEKQSPRRIRRGFFNAPGWVRSERLCGKLAARNRFLRKSLIAAPTAHFIHPQAGAILFLHNELRRFLTNS